MLLKNILIVIKIYKINKSSVTLLKLNLSNYNLKYITHILNKNNGDKTFFHVND